MKRAVLHWGVRGHGRPLLRSVPPECPVVRRELDDSVQVLTIESNARISATARRSGLTAPTDTVRELLSSTRRIVGTMIVDYRVAWTEPPTAVEPGPASLLSVTERSDP